MALASLLLALYLCISICESQCNEDVANTKKNRDRRPNKNYLRIVTYNAEWLYRDGCNDIDTLKNIIPKSLFPIWDQTNKENTGNPVQWKIIQGYMDAHMAKIATYLDDVKADIFVIEEACDCATLDAVRQMMKNKEEYRAYLIENEKGSGMQTGIITRIDPTPKVNNKAKIELVDSMKRDRVFKATFDIGDRGKKLILFGAHLTATESESAIKAREKQADNLNEAADNAAQESDDNYVVVTGDLNTKKEYHYYEMHKDVLNGNKQKMRDYYEELRDEGDKFTGVKLQDGDNSIEVVNDKRDVKAGYKLLQVIVKQTTKPKPAPIGVINCGGKKLAYLLKEYEKIYNELNDIKYNNKNFAMQMLYTTPVKHDEDTLSKLAQNNFKQVTNPTNINSNPESLKIGTAMSGAKPYKYSHWDCAGKKEDGILDYFFFSKSVLNDNLHPKLIYHHEIWYYYPLHFIIYKSYERVCSGFSDHTPVELKLRTLTRFPIFQYNARGTYYGNYYENDEQRSILPFDFELIILVLFVMVLCIMSGLVCGCIAGYIYASGNVFSNSDKAKKSVK
eukprot:180012_1